MTSKREQLECLLLTIGRPRQWIDGPPHLSPAERFAAAVSARRVWAEKNPDLERRHHEVVAQLNTLIEVEEQQRQEANEIARISDGLDAAGIGARNLEALEAGLDPTDAVQAVEEFIQGRRTFLLLTGSPGTGKSVAACIAVRRAVEHRRGALFARAVEVSRLSLFDHDGKVTVARMRRVSMLVIDDLGVEGLNDGWRSTFEDVLDARYQERLDTVMTSNLDVAAFKLRYGARVIDRIRHDGAIVSCGSESLRKRGAA